jgi:hypothetical protein
MTDLLLMNWARTSVEDGASDLLVDDLRDPLARYIQERSNIVLIETSCQ